jgi:hypothetical protein
MQTLLPEKANVEFFSGEKLYMIDGINYPPQRDTGPAPECRVEISATEAKNDHIFVHVLTATKDDVVGVPLAKATVTGKKLVVSLGYTIEFDL